MLALVDDLGAARITVLTEADHCSRRRTAQLHPLEAVIGLGGGALLVAVLIWLPAAQSGDFYEFTDPLIFMGLPIVTICVAAGALVGVSGAPVSGDGWTRPSRGTSCRIADVESHP